MTIMIAGLFVLAILLVVGMHARKFIQTSVMVAVICAICLSMIAGRVIFSSMIERYSKTVSITATQQKNENSQGEDIGIKAITVQGREIDLSDSKYEDQWLYQNDTLSWGYAAQTTIDVMVPQYSDAQIQFVSNQWAGKVEVNDGSDSQVIDLYSPIDTIQSVTIGSKNTNLFYSFAIKTMGLIALFAILIFCACLVISHHLIRRISGEFIYKLKEVVCQNPYFLARIAIICCSFVVMLYFAGDLSLWSDDLATIEFVSEQNTLTQNIESILVDATHNPPLYYFLAFFWLRLVPYGTIWIKLMNILLVCLGIFICGALAKKIRGERAAMMTTILASSSYFLISQAAYTFRSYGLLYPLSALLLYLYYKRLEHPEKKVAYVQYGIVVALLLYTHYTSIIVLGLFGVCDCWLYARKKIKISFLASYIGAGIAFMPLILYKFDAMVKDHQNYWPATPDFNALKALYTGLLNKSTLSMGMFVAGIAIFFVICFSNSIRQQTKYSWADVTTIAVAIVIIIGTIGFMYIYSAFINPQGSIFVIRYFTIIVPAVLMITGITISDLTDFLTQDCANYVKICVPIIVCAAVFAINMEQCVSDLENFPGTINTPYEQAIDWIYKRNDALNDDTLVMMTGYQGGLYYYGTHNFRRENLNFGILTQDNWRDYQIIYAAPMHGEFSDEANQILQDHYEEVTKNETLYVTAYRQK